MKKTIATGVISCLLSYSAFAADNGLITVKSHHSVEQTAEKLINVLESKGMTVFTQIKHDEGAKKVGMELRPTRLVIFGNPKVGTPLMKCSQTTAIDLPQKMLIWQDASGENWLSYNSPDYLNDRHGLEGCAKVIGKVKQALGNFAKAATQ
ncbi:conserved hypothetical protein [Vibrio nigripulchritudo SO65]|uniref:DUF302 domain-containing protein n=1 Tax=Vibrio nigripulchritudo TaxID=28173 RepID=UPI0003B1872A|nr:DUF302 domain-containing protein [Vibrio nigripulchritudo]CCN37563.1 conserved hypothetical protein [Vibrio nigripulchritudo AM115]CCN39575.1 conserved hypothetical protein [Vibrio nigripulchritudo FTn2]CCN66799.1 conserved hypothetical protein [Vibrio nigripulchritudo POn4]CCN75675.1 conserved hypothetical protein [Vibrio nigripulchritudo SO65]